MSRVACVKVGPKTTDVAVVFRAVSRAMRLISWQKEFKKGNLVIKVNTTWDKFYPSCTTTPMVVEGVIKEILASGLVSGKEISIVDTNTAAFMNVDWSFKNQGFDYLAERYGVKLVNLSKTKFAEVPFKGLVLSKLKVSRVLLSADNLISLPVLKTHSYSLMTGALKNQWGCIHDLRHNFHLVLSEAIADVNKFFKKQVRFALMDGLFGMEGDGPKSGDPKKIGYIFASLDLVSLDSAAASVMGFNLSEVKHIGFAAKMKVGESNFAVVGDRLPTFKFKAPKPNPAMYWEMTLRRLGPEFEKLFFAGDSVFLPFLRLAARIYYDWWYEIFGKKKAKRMAATNFGQIWQRRYIR